MQKKETTAKHSVIFSALIIILSYSFICNIPWVTYEVYDIFIQGQSPGCYAKNSATMNFFQWMWLAAAIIYSH